MVLLRLHTRQWRQMPAPSLMPSKKKDSAIRDRMWKRDPCCRRCGIVTWSPRHRFEVTPGNSPDEKNANFQASLTHEERKTMATLEHTVSRLDPMRKVFQPGIRRRTLFCFDCNQKTGAEKVRALHCPG